MSNRTWRKRNRKEFLFVLLFLLIGGVALSYISAQSSNEKTIRVYFQNPDDGSKTSIIRAEVADTPGTRERGLMFRKPGELSNDEGMLFVFPVEKQLSFWMKNTYINLDMIFIDSNKRVLGVIHDVPAGTTEMRSIAEPGRYVLELVAGTAREKGIAKGWELHSLSNFPVAVQ